MSMGVHHPYHLDLCADNEDPSQLIIQTGWDVPDVLCFPRALCAWPCLLRQVGTNLGSPHDCVVAGLAYANPGSRQDHGEMNPIFTYSGGIRTYLYLLASRCICRITVINMPYCVNLY